MSKASIFILTALFIVAVSHSAVASRGRFVGGRTKVCDVRSNREVQELGRFSVENFNLSGHLGLRGIQNAPLRFVEVVEAEKQVVAGIKYYLKVETLQGGHRRVFDAEVVVKPWLQSKKLLHFGPSSTQLL